MAAACHRQKNEVVKQLLRAGASVDAIPSVSSKENDTLRQPNVKPRGIFGVWMKKEFCIVCFLEYCSNFFSVLNEASAEDSCS